MPSFQPIVKISLLYFVYRVNSFNTYYTYETFLGPELFMKL